MDLDFDGVVWHWRGPAPFHFVSLSEADADAVAAVSSAVSYGWGMVPVTVTVGDTSITTALWPKDGTYVVPLKTALRRAEGIELDDTIHVRLQIDV